MRLCNLSARVSMCLHARVCARIYLKTAHSTCTSLPKASEQADSASRRTAPASGTLVATAVCIVGTRHASGSWSAILSTNRPLGLGPQRPVPLHFGFMCVCLCLPASKPKSPTVQMTRQSARKTAQVCSST